MEEKKNNKTIIWGIVGLLLIVGAFFGGFLLNSGNSKCKSEPAKTEEKKEEKQAEKSNIPVTDKFTVNLYADSVGVYVIDNGDLYYLKPEILDEGTRYFLLTHSGCLSDGSSAYCKGNEPYNKKPVKVEGISNVVRVKLFNGYKSGGESFQTYAITKDGDVYEINENKAGKLAFTGVEDMVGNSNNEVVVVYKDGTTKVSEYVYEGATTE